MLVQAQLAKNANLTDTDRLKAIKDVRGALLTAVGSGQKHLLGQKPTMGGPEQRRGTKVVGPGLAVEPQHQKGDREEPWEG